MFLVVKDFFTAEECHKYIAYIEAKDTELINRRFRYGFDCPEDVAVLWQRLKPQYPFLEVKDKFGTVWKACGLNSHIRVVKYHPGQGLSLHEDGFYQPAYNCRSFATAMVYLNSVKLEDGGATHFTELSLRLQPQQGLGVFFLVDDLLHTGEPCQQVKYLWRSDVMYECTPQPVPIDHLYQKWFAAYQEAQQFPDNPDLWLKTNAVEVELKRLCLKKTGP